MPKINRSSNVYVKIPDSPTDARLQVSLNVTVPKEYTGKVDKFMKEAHTMMEDAFKKFMKKEIKKRTEGE